MVLQLVFVWESLVMSLEEVAKNEVKETNECLDKELVPQEQFSLDVLKKAAAIAAEASLQSQLEAEYMHLFIDVKFDNDRVQGVIVRDKTVNRNMPVLGIFSPCMRIKRAEIADKLPNLAYRMLQANERINFASYALIENEEDIMVIASFETLLEEVTPKAFRAGVMAVALAADLFEEKLGKNEF
ncbi:MAG: hypothetical protein ACI38Q_08535 [Candidatus Bruticola sp.]